MAVVSTNIKKLTLGKGGEGEIWQRRGRFIRSWSMGRSEKFFVVVKKYLSFRVKPTVAVKFAIEATVVSVGGRFAAEFGNTNSVNLSYHKRRRMSLLLGEDNRYSVKAGYCFPSTTFLSEIVVYLGGIQGSGISSSDKMDS
ncbi:hypothetical protein QL285_072357 [Trifolium repens]|nr:hypothetical protein QL285_072357 [Trifolium repens]